MNIEEQAVKYMKALQARIGNIDWVKWRGAPGNPMGTIFLYDADEKKAVIISEDYAIPAKQDEAWWLDVADMIKMDVKTFREAIEDKIGKVVRVKLPEQKQLRESIGNNICSLPVYFEGDTMVVVLEGKSLYKDEQ